MSGGGGSGMVVIGAPEGSDSNSEESAMESMARKMKKMKEMMTPRRRSQRGPMMVSLPSVSCSHSPSRSCFLVQEEAAAVAVVATAAGQKVAAVGRRTGVRTERRVPSQKVEWEQR